MALRAKRADGQRNRQAILDAASRVFARDGFIVPMDRIAAEANVGRATVYRNFSNREALAFAIFDQNVVGFERLGEATAPRPGGFRIMLDALLDDIADHAALGQALALSEGEDVLLRLSDRIIDVLDRFRIAAIEAGEIRSDLSRDDLVLLLETLGMGLSMGPLDQRREKARRMIALLVDGIAA